VIKEAPNHGVTLAGDAVIGLEKMILHIITKDLLQNQIAFAAAHHCLRSLLESMVDLKEITESSESDRSGSSSESDSGSSDGDDSINVSFYMQPCLLFCLLPLYSIQKFFPPLL